MLAFVKSALANLPIVEAFIFRDASVSFFPVVPLVGPTYALYAAPRATIEEHYQSFDAFAAAWDTAETIGGLKVFTRGRGIARQYDFWRDALPKHGKLAYAVKPGRTIYYADRDRPYWLDYVKTLPRKLEQLGYSDARKTLEYTAYLEPDAHLSLADLDELAYLKEHGLASGEPLDSIVVTFANREMAERELRPLSDLGIVVQYHAPDGSFKVIDEPSRWVNPAELLAQV